MRETCSKHSGFSGKEATSPKVVLQQRRKYSANHGRCRWQLEAKSRSGHRTASDEFRVFLAGRKDRSHWDVARLGWVADYDDPSSFLEVLTQGSNQNDPGYSSASFNELIVQSRLEARPDRRIILLRRAETVLLNDYPVIPLYFYRGRRLVKPYIGGAQITPMNRTYCKNLFWQGDS